MNYSFFEVVTFGVGRFSICHCVLHLLLVFADDTLRDVDGMSAVHWSIQKNDTRALRASV